MARRLSDWLLTNPVLVSPGYPYDVALLYGAQWDNAVMDERLVENFEEFRRRYAFPRLVAGRAEDFFRDVERRFGSKLPVRRGDTGLYWEDGAASTAAELAHYRATQLAARALELLALWDGRTEAPDAEGAGRIRRRADERRQIWRDLLLFGEHTWGAAGSVAEPEGRQTVAQWEYKRRFLDGAAAALEQQLAAGLLRIGRATAAGPGRLVFNASSWPRTDVVRLPGGAGRRLVSDGREWPAVDLPDGSALVMARDVPALGYLALAERAGTPNPAQDGGAGLEAQTGSFHVVLDPGTGAIHSLTGGDGRDRVKPGAWSGLNELVYVTGGAKSALWTDAAREHLAAAPELSVATARLDSARRERLAVERPGHAPGRAERHRPRPMAPQDRPGRHIARVRDEQLLAHELRGASGRRVRVPLPDLAARAVPRRGCRRAGAARLGGVRPAVREPALREPGRRAAPRAGRRAVHQGHGRPRAGREAGGRR